MKRFKVWGKIFTHHKLNRSSNPFIAIYKRTYSTQQQTKTQFKNRQI